MCFGLEIAANCANASLGVFLGASSSMIWTSAHGYCKRNKGWEKYLPFWKVIKPNMRINLAFSESEQGDIFYCRKSLNKFGFETHHFAEVCFVQYGWSVSSSKHLVWHTLLNHFRYPRKTGIHCPNAHTNIPCTCVKFSLLQSTYYIRYYNLKNEFGAHVCVALLGRWGFARECKRETHCSIIVYKTTP